MIGYKVCSKEDGKYMSYCRFPGRAIREYILNQTTIPGTGFGPLCVFDTLADAICFIKFDGALEKDTAIFRCEYSPSSKTYLYDGINKWDILKCSSGTVFADDVTIMEEINA